VATGSSSRWRIPAPRLTLAVAVFAAFAGTAAASVNHPAKKTATGPKPASAAAWKALIAKAKQEGSVTIYSPQAPDALATVASKFKALYGITVTVNRNSDNPLVAQINAEESTGKAIADIWTSASKPYVSGALKHGWVVDGVGPNFFKKRYDRKTYMFGKAWIDGEAVLGVAWNTQAYHGTIKSVTDFLQPVFKGKINAPDPRISSANVDWYLWAAQEYGSGFMAKLAAQNPKIYPSVLPATQAVASGEIIGATEGFGSALDLKAQGAPIDYGVVKNNWNAPMWGMILKQAPHPAAAQLLANFLLSPQGQAAVNHTTGAVYPNIPQTYYVPPRKINVKFFTKAKVDAFVARWTSLFVH
jgi:iron(III) transport system substrate-binding protein